MNRKNIETLLHPCPFCGNSNIRVHPFSFFLHEEDLEKMQVTWRIEMICDFCNLVLAFDYTGNIGERAFKVLLKAEEAAVEKWNTRFCG